MARRPTPSSRRRDLVHPKLPPTITLAVAAEVVGHTVILTSPEPMTYNVRMSRPLSALPGLTYTDANGTHNPQLVTLSADNTIATVYFGVDLLTPGTLIVAITMQALRSFRGGQIVIGMHAFPSPYPTTTLGFAAFADGSLSGQGRWTAVGGADHLNVDTFQALIDPAATTEGKNKGDVSDLVSNALTLNYTLEWKSSTIAAQQQIYLNDAMGSLIWLIQFWRHSGDDIADTILATSAGTATQVNQSMAIDTPHTIQIRATNDHCELWLNGVMILTATLVNGNQNAFDHVVLEQYAANTTPPTLFVSAMTITPTA